LVLFRTSTLRNVAATMKGNKIMNLPKVLKRIFPAFDKTPNENLPVPFEGESELHQAHLERKAMAIAETERLDSTYTPNEPTPYRFRAECLVEVKSFVTAVSAHDHECLFNKVSYASSSIVDDEIYDIHTSLSRYELIRVGNALDEGQVIAQTLQRRIHYSGVRDHDL